MRAAKGRGTLEKEQGKRKVRLHQSRACFIVGVRRRAHLANAPSPIHLIPIISSLEIEIHHEEHPPPLDRFFRLPQHVSFNSIPSMPRYHRTARAALASMARDRRLDLTWERRVRAWSWISGGRGTDTDTYSIPTRAQQDRKRQDTTLVRCASECIRAEQSGTERKGALKLEAEGRYCLLHTLGTMTATCRLGA